MHRTLKRVALDFKWPLNREWEGYVNPYPGPLNCNLCDGTGYNLPTKQIEEDFYAFDDRSRAWHDKITQDEVQALVDADRLWGFTRIPITEEQREVVRKKMAEGGNSWLPYNNGRIPTADEVNALNSRPGLFGHDAINRSILVKARAMRLGVYGPCPVCNGEGSIPHPNEAIRKLHEEWNPYEPPTGDGYQLWETVSEGSPMSPIFQSVEDLAHWCVENNAMGGDQEIPYARWVEMLSEEGGVEAGSIIVATKGYFGSAANLPGTTQ